MDYWRNSDDIFRIFLDIRKYYLKYQSLTDTILDKSEVSFENNHYYLSLLWEVQVEYLFILNLKTKQSMKNVMWILILKMKMNNQQIGYMLEQATISK